MLVSVLQKYSAAQFTGYLNLKSGLTIYEKQANIKYKNEKAVHSSRKAAGSKFFATGVPHTQ